MSKSKAERLHDWIRAHRDWPNVEFCKEFLAELDKPELHGDAKEILQTLVDKKSCVVKVDGSWRYVAEKFLSCHDGTYEQAVKGLIEAGLLHAHKVMTPYPGMTHYTFVTDAGREAIK